jgi:hypothetical protein
MVSTSSNRLPFRSVFILGNKKSDTAQSWENMEVSARVGFYVCLRNVARVETSALVHCCVGFAGFLTATFLVACGILCCRDPAELVNNISIFIV